VDDETRRRIQQSYLNAKQRGVRFFPDIIYKDLLVSFAVFLLLVGLATFLGVAAEPPADPSDSSYIPRPEWYFLFLFQLLKYFPGKLEWVGTTVVPGLAVLALLLLPFYDRNPFRPWRRRRLALSVMGAAVAGMVGLTILAAVTTPAQEETAALTTVSDRYLAGQDLYGVECVECHGESGEGGEIKGVEGLEGFVMKPLNVGEYMYTREDRTLAEIIAYGQPERGMPPFGRTYGGELPPGDIQAIVTFMRYAWDDRMQIPEDAAAAGSVPALAEGEIPSYTVHIAPIVRRTCLSCHRPGKKNNNYLMGSYQEILTTGDHTPNLVAGDLGSNLIRQLHREDVEAGGPMPPTRPLKSEWIDIFERWVLAGMPEFPVTPTPGETPSTPAASPASPGTPSTAAPSPTSTATP